MKRIAKLFLVFLAICCIFATVSGCSKKQTQAQSTATEAKPKFTGNGEILIIGTNWQHPYWTDVEVGIKHAQKVLGPLGIKIVKAGPNTFDNQAQIDTILQAINQNPSGMAIAAFDSSLIPAIQKALAAGIPTITFESDLPDSGRLTYVGVDNYDYGLTLGRLLIDGKGESGTYAISTNAGASNSETRIRGLKDYLKNYPGWKLVGITEDKADIQTGADAAKALMQKNKDLSAYIGINASSGPAIAVAAKEFGNAGKLAIYCCDRDNATLTAIKDGTIQSTVIAKTASSPYYAALLLTDFAMGGADLPLTKNNKAAGVSPLPYNVYVGSLVITKDNIQYFE